MSGTNSPQGSDIDTDSSLLLELVKGAHGKNKRIEAEKVSKPKKVNPRRRAKVCALCPADCVTTVSGSWYQISPHKTIVKTPVILPILKPGVDECCAKCYMKNRRLWEKRMQSLGQSKNEQIPVKFEQPKSLPLAPLVQITPTTPNIYEQEHLRVQKKILETQNMINVLRSIAATINELNDQTDKLVVSQFILDSEVFLTLMLNYSLQLLNASTSNVQLIDIYAFNSQEKAQYAKLTNSFTIFTIRPSLQSYVSLLCNFFQPIKVPSPTPAITTTSLNTPPCPSPTTETKEGKLPAFEFLLEEIEKQQL